MEMKTNSLVSVIIPVYNCERYLAEAIESVLAQTYQNLEAIVVDDGSNDHSADVARSFQSRVRYYHQINAGAGAARNRGVEFAGGEMLAFLDADDRWVDEKLALQVAVLQTNPKLDMVFGQARQLREGAEWEQGIRESRYDGPDLMAGIGPGTMLVRIESFSRVGPFRTDLKVGEFIDWYARAVEAGLSQLTLPNLLLQRRLHDANSGILEVRSRSDYARVLKASLDRRRAAKTNPAES